MTIKFEHRDIDIRSDSPGANAARLTRFQELAVAPKNEIVDVDRCIEIQDGMSVEAEAYLFFFGMSDQPVEAGGTVLSRRQSQITGTKQANTQGGIEDNTSPSECHSHPTARPPVFSGSTIAVLVVTALLLFGLCGMASIDLVRSMWGWDGYSPANGWLIEALGGLFK